jgi:hypothetical protein
VWAEYTTPVPPAELLQRARTAHNHTGCPARRHVQMNSETPIKWEEVKLIAGTCTLSKRHGAVLHGAILLRREADIG